MTPEQQNKLQSIKSALKQHIEEAEKATPGPWEIDKSNGWDQAIAMQPCIFQRNAWTSDLDAAFIARARTMSPLACKMALAGIECAKLHSALAFVYGIPSTETQVQRIIDLWEGGKA